MNLVIRAEHGSVPRRKKGTNQLSVANIRTQVIAIVLVSTVDYTKSIVISIASGWTN